MIPFLLHFFFACKCLLRFSSPGYNEGCNLCGGLGSQGDKEVKLISEGHTALMQLDALNMAQRASIRGTQNVPQAPECSPTPLALTDWCCLCGWVTQSQEHSKVTLWTPDWNEKEERL